MLASQDESRVSATIGLGLGALCLSLAARFAADICLASTLVYRQLPPGPTLSYWAIFFLLTPLVATAVYSGLASDRWPKHWVLASSVLWCTCAGIIVTLSAGISAPAAEVGLALLSFGTVIFGMALCGVLPAAAKASRLPVPRIVGWSATVAGLGTIAGLALTTASFPLRGTVLVLNGASLLAAFFARFPPGCRTEEVSSRSLERVKNSWMRIFATAPTPNLFFAQFCFVGLIVASLTRVLTHPLDSANPTEPFIVPALWFCVGLVAGSLLASWQAHPTRALGLVPCGATFLAPGIAWMVLVIDPRWPCLFVGVMAGIIHVPLLAAYLTALSARRRSSGIAWLLGMSSTLAVTILFWALEANESWWARPWWLIAAATLLGAWCWYQYLRQALEQLMEMFLWPIYRVQVQGPGLDEFPANGSVLMVANHTAWFDPLWLAKVTPREVTPMMTSLFYDLPVLRFLMERIVHAIRVPAASFRREAPELQEGIAVLDRGGCLVIFPEGFVKRRPEQVLHFFAQGVWRILSQRPNTPVVACWIEGGWGSYTSYCGGKPMTGKPLDWWWSIRIGMDCPQILSPQLLADQRATRAYLMQACLDARSYLNLEPVSMDVIVAKGEEAASVEEEESSGEPRVGESPG